MLSPVPQQWIPSMLLRRKMYELGFAIIIICVKVLCSNDNYNSSVDELSLMLLAKMNTFIIEVVPAYERLDRYSITSRTPNLSLFVTRAMSGFSFRFSSFPNFIPPFSTFQPPLRVISYFHPFISCHPSSCSWLGKLVGFGALPMWVRTILHLTLNLGKHNLEQNGSKKIDRHSLI